MADLSVRRRLWPEISLVDAHDGVLALSADEAGFLAVVCAEVVVVDHTRGEEDALADAGFIEIAVEIDPFAAIR